jgi:hypothetical protein
VVATIFRFHLACNLFIKAFRNKLNINSLLRNAQIITTGIISFLYLFYVYLQKIRKVPGDNFIK